FQAEDGIRDYKVTGVQTCALPISSLWDFPPGLFKREVAADELARALGWALVPPTARREGPFGDGSLQLYVPADFEQHYFTLREEIGRASCRERVESSALGGAVKNE